MAPIDMRSIVMNPVTFSGKKGSRISVNNIQDDLIFKFATGTKIRKFCERLGH